MLDPSRDTHPLLYDLVKLHVDYYREAGEYVSRRSIETDIRKDSAWPDVLREAAIDETHPNARAAFRRVLWPVIGHYMNPDTGWWAKSYGQGALWYHESFGTPEDGRDASNLRIRDRERDEKRLMQVVHWTETKCGQLQMVFDPQFDDDTGQLVRVEVWAA